MNQHIKMKQYIKWQKTTDGLFQRVGYSDEGMATLSIFLKDGLSLEEYISFLKDEDSKEFYSNISCLKKDGAYINILIYDDIFPDMLPYRMKISNLITLLDEFKKHEHQGVDTIELSFLGDTMTLIGS